MSDSSDQRRRPGPESGSGEERVPRALREAWGAVSDQEPPDLVDQAVLNRARAAVERPHSSRPWSFGWLHALTTAAVIVLAITLILPLRNTGQPGGEPEPPTPASSSSSSSSSSSARQATEIQALEEAARRDVPVPANRERLGPSGDSSSQEATPRALASPALENAESVPRGASADAEPASDLAARLQAIRDLVEAGEQEAAREALVAFQLDFPDVDLPPDLAALLDAEQRTTRP